MPGADAAREKRARIGNPRPRLALERRAEQRDRELRGDLAVQVAAQAVGDRQQQARGARPAADAVLVHAARAEAGLLDDGVFHLALLRRSGSFSPSSAFCSANTLCGRSR